MGVIPTYSTSSSGRLLVVLHDVAMKSDNAIYNMYLLLVFIFTLCFCRVLRHCGLCLGLAETEKFGEAIHLASPHKTGTIFREALVENVALVLVAEETHIAHCRLVETIFQRDIVDKRAI